jgi:Mn2+/Fe2+ NRAMP family transporter
VEFIGVEQSLSFFGLPNFWAVLLSAILLFAVMAGGTYRYWERFLILLVIANIVTFPVLESSIPLLDLTALGASLVKCRGFRVDEGSQFRLPQLCYRGLRES